MVFRFPNDHRAPNFTDCVYIKMVKTGELGYHLPSGSTSLSTEKVGPFKTKCEVGDLAHDLELPDHIKIHIVISVVYLEQASADALYRRPPLSTKADNCI